MPGKQPKPLRLDAATTRTLSLVQSDAPTLVGGILAEHLDAIEASPEVCAWITGRSAAAIRSACDTGSLPHKGARKRWVRLDHLAAWSGMAITPTRLVSALEHARDSASFVQWHRAVPVPMNMGDACDLDDGREPQVTGLPSLVARGLKLGARTLAETWR